MTLINTSSQTFKNTLQSIHSNPLGNKVNWLSTAGLAVLHIHMCLVTRSGCFGRTAMTRSTILSPIVIDQICCWIQASSWAWVFVFQWLILKVNKIQSDEAELYPKSWGCQFCPSVCQSFQKRKPSLLAEYSAFGGYLARKMQKTLLKGCRRPRGYLAPTIIMSK